MELKKEVSFGTVELVEGDGTIQVIVTSNGVSQIIDVIEVVNDSDVAVYRINNCFTSSLAPSGVDR